MPPRRVKNTNSNEFDFDDVSFVTSTLSDESRLIVSMMMFTMKNMQGRFKFRLKR